MKWDLWVLIGLLGQTAFFMRFLVQWVVSEKNQESTIPVAFWYFSLAGGMVLLAYSVYRRDPVFIFGQSTGVFIYVRNLMLIRKKSKVAHAGTTAAATGA